MRQNRKRQIKKLNRRVRELELKSNLTERLSKHPIRYRFQLLFELFGDEKDVWLNPLMRTCCERIIRNQMNEYDTIKELVKAYNSLNESYRQFAMNDMRPTQIIIKEA